MKSFEFSKKRIQSIWIVIFLLVIITIGIIIGCGKLTEDEYPGSPVGTSGGTMSLPVGPQSSWGTYSLTVKAHPPIIPADGVTYAIVKAILEDTSGRSLENFLISFSTISSDMACQFQVPPSEPGGPSTFSSTIQGLTGTNGKVSVLLYGMHGGSCVVQATIDIDEDGSEDLFTTTNLTVSGGPGVPGPGVTGVELTADDPYKTVDLGVCGETEPGSETFTLTANVWDGEGNPVGAGTRVELSGDISMSTVYWAETNANGEAQWAYTYTAYSPGLYSFTITATTVINGETYTDTITLYLDATCDVPTPTPVPTATPVPYLTVTANPAGLTTGPGNTSTIDVCTSDSATGVSITVAVISGPGGWILTGINPGTTGANGCISTNTGTITFTENGTGTYVIGATATGYASGGTTILVNP